MVHMVHKSFNRLWGKVFRRSELLLAYVYTDSVWWQADPETTVKPVLSLIILSQLDLLHQRMDSLCQ